MLENKLKLNSGKTEIIVLSSSCLPRPVLNNLVIASDIVDFSNIAKNTGVIFSNSLSTVPHFTAVCKSSVFIYALFLQICKFVSHDKSESLIHAFITARTNYCNSLLYGQPKCILRWLDPVFLWAQSQISESLILI